jgi:DNA polymerase-3 subunit delta
VVVNNAEALNKKADVTSLIQYFKNPNTSATLVLLSDENKIETKLQGAAPKAGVRVFWEMFENEKKGWLMKTFQNFGHSITPEGAEFFLEWWKTPPMSSKTKQPGFPFFSDRARK